MNPTDPSCSDVTIQSSLDKHLSRPDKKREDHWQGEGGGQGGGGGAGRRGRGRVETTCSLCMYMYVYLYELITLSPSLSLSPCPSLPASLLPSFLPQPLLHLLIRKFSGRTGWPLAAALNWSQIHTHIPTITIITITMVTVWMVIVAMVTVSSQHVPCHVTVMTTPTPPHMTTTMGR